MAEKLKKVECDPKCGFLIQSHEEKEVVDIAIQHAKKAHSMAITEKDVRMMMKDAQIMSLCNTLDERAWQFQALSHNGSCSLGAKVQIIRFGGDAASSPVERRER